MTTSEHTLLTPLHALACMEIWGGNERIDSGLSTPGLDAWVYSRPFEDDDSGGDLHYVSMCNSGNISRFFIADVSGHGNLVAELTRSLRTLMRKHINTPDNTNFTRALNEAFQMESTGGKFATALLTTYFAPTDELIIVNAGHPRPLHLHRASMQWRVLNEAVLAGMPESTSSSNLPLGVIDPTDFSQFAITLQRGDLVVLYTDGLMEASDASGVMLGEAGLLRILRTLDADRPDRLIPELLARIEQHQGGKSIADDVTAVVLHHNAEPPPSYSLRSQITALAKTMGLVRV